MKRQELEDKVMQVFNSVDMKEQEMLFITLMELASTAVLETWLDEVTRED